MVRNRCIEEAKRLAVDLVVMIDSDILPDAVDFSGAPSDEPFWESSFGYWWDNARHGSPAIIAAPYCGPPPIENVYVFRWSTYQSGVQDHWALRQFEREEAARLSGILPVAALPTGLILIDMRVFTGFRSVELGKDVRLPHPYFYYEWTDEKHTQKASTEDVTFTRDCGLAGAKVLCNWDAWCVHLKLKKVGKPTLLHSADILRRYRELSEREYDVNDEDTVTVVSAKRPKV
jgi:hypothetical protein